MFNVYILRCKTKKYPKKRGKLYTGYTNDLNRRLEEHLNKKSKYTSRFDNIKLVYSEQFLTRKEAMKREREIKKFSRKEKLYLIKMAQTV